MALFGYLATFFTFAALVLQVFSMIGTTYNRPFLRDLYFAKVTIRNDFYIFGLWSYCTGDIRSRDSSSFVVESCSKPVPAFDWTNTEGINRYFRDIGDLYKLFLADFILYWIALGFTLLALIITIMSHFRRGPDLLASLMTFIAFIIQMVVFIIMLVVGIRGVNAVKSYDPDIANGQLGPSMWMTLGAFVALLISSIAYCFACIFGRGRTHSGEKA